MNSVRQCLCAISMIALLVGPSTTRAQPCPAPEASCANQASAPAFARWRVIDPEYPAAHLCAAGSTVAVLTSVFGTEQIAFRLDSRAPDTTVHAFNSTGEFLSEIQSARIYGGMHFRTSAVDGAALGMNVGKWVAERGFGLR